MRLLFAAFALSLVVGAAAAADSADNGIKKGFSGFSGTVRGTVKVDQNASGGPAVWVEQAGGPAVRILTDSISEWRSLDNSPASIRGDVVLFGGQPVMVVKKATPRKEKVGAANANFDVQGRILFTPQGDAAIKTRDGFIRIGNPEIVARLKELGVGAKVKVKGVLSAGSGGLILNAASMREDHEGSRSKAVGLTLGKKPVRGKAASVGIAVAPATDAAKTKEARVALKKPRKKGGKHAGDVWDTHKKVVTIGQPN